MAKGKERAMNFHSHKVRVGDAGSKGRGVFTRCAIRKGEAVEAAPTLVIPTLDFDLIAKTFLSNYVFSHNEDFELIGLGYISLYNHSFTPNAQFVLMRRAVLMVAIQPIAEGDEVTFDYGWPDASFREAGIAMPAPGGGA